MDDREAPVVANIAANSSVRSVIPDPHLAADHINQNGEIDLPKLPRGLRVSQIAKPTGVLPMSRSHWYAGVKKGIYPQPVIRSGRLTIWNTVQVLKLLEVK